MNWRRPFGERVLLTIVELLARITVTMVWVALLLMYLAILALYWVGVPVGVYYLVRWAVPDPVIPWWAQLP